MALKYLLIKKRCAGGKTELKGRAQLKRFMQKHLQQYNELKLLKESQEQPVNLSVLCTVNDIKQEQQQ